MIYKNKKVEYEYWNDPNELCECLRLLIVAKEGWNTSVQTEIVPIIMN